MNKTSPDAETLRARMISQDDNRRSLGLNRMAWLLNKQGASVVATSLTSLGMFAIFLVQGIVVARMLGPIGRGEFGTALYFPRDVLLYAGLLGSVEVIVAHAANGFANLRELRFAAMRVGALTGFITAIVAALISTLFLVYVGKAYIIPFCLVVCLFLPLEHIQLTVSAVDRGKRNIARYNLHRIIFALTFPLMALIAWQTELAQAIGISQLWLVCILFVVSKVFGLLPTMWNTGVMSLLLEKLRTFRANRHRGENRVGSKQLLKDGRPYAGAMLASELLDRLDILLMVALADVMTTGHYFVAVPAAALIYVVPSSFGIFMFNIGASKTTNPSLFQFSAGYVATLVFQIVSTAVMMLVLPYLIIWLYGENFGPGIQFALLLLPAYAIKGIVHGLEAYLKGRGRPDTAIRIRIVGIGGLLVTALALYPSLGIIAIPISAIVGQAVCMFLMTISTYKDVGQQAAASNHPLHAGGKHE
ncbi:MAG TPA: hypothetical protein PKD64_02960 [Pirellulaceae bacterium]|nr:hypothetical protein [Pirellulaceae bacterium]HMO91129.1 hypothetical protein [Pirellulaceae bacterium]HMP71069.1 hypothetical protein [Pirellulaceae bacterium]